MGCISDSLIDCGFSCRLAISFDINYQCIYKTFHVLIEDHVISLASVGYVAWLSLS